MKYVLTNGYSYPSAKLLRDAISAITGERITVTSDPNKVRGNLLVRYGCSDPVNSRVRDYNCNPPEFISMCANKRITSGALTSHNIWTPIFYASVIRPETYPVMIRSTLTSSGGRGITVVNNVEEFNANWGQGCVWTPFVRTSSEYRVHVLNGTVGKVFRKVRNTGLAEEVNPVRNLHRGYHFSLVQNVDGLAKLNELVAQLNTFITGKFYALDCGYVRGTGYIVFELNSAPGLNEETAGRYARCVVDSIYPGRFNVNRTEQNPEGA
jgi:glutathione synthase/RimK-type ligase-like ATP-grasp enzyme